MADDTSLTRRDSRTTALALRCVDLFSLINTLLSCGYIRIRRTACEVARLWRRDAVIAVYITGTIIFIGSRSASFELLTVTRCLVFATNGGEQHDA